MSAANAPAMRGTSQPGSWVGPENPNPGIEGTTRWKASAVSPPWAAGSARGSMTSSSSTTEPGQPWMASSGRASRSEEHTSELQSPDHLVCRLLLEKKKKKKKKQLQNQKKQIKKQTQTTNK